MMGITAPAKRCAKAAVAALARRAGFAVVPAWRTDELLLAVHLRELFKAEAIDCVLDVGANRGQYRDLLREEVGYRGAIVSFEPIPDLAAGLHARAAGEGDRLWQVQALALGDEDAERPLNVMAADGMSSLLAARSEGVCPSTAVWNTPTRTEVVPVRRLDGLAAGIGPLRSARAVYLKLDTQGYELHVLAGASSVLRSSVRALQSELGVRPLYEGMPDYMTAIGTINSLGFELSGLFAVSRDRHLRLVEFDGVFVRRR